MVSPSPTSRMIKPGGMSRSRSSRLPSPSPSLVPAIVERPRRSPDASAPDAFHLYLRDIGTLPLLTREEETALGRRVRQGDVTARAELIQGNLRLVVKLARDYEHMGLPLLDLIAEGNVGLMKAVDRFDPARGVKLSVYAAFWIKQCMRRALGNHSRTIRLPIHVHDRLTGLERTARRLRELFGRTPTDGELAHEAGLSPARLAALRRSMLSFSSLDAPLSDDETHSLAETLPDEEAGTPYEHLAGDAMRDLLHQFLAELPPRHAFVLRLRFGLDGDERLTLEEVAKKVSVTRERVRQIQQAAIRTLHQWIRKLEAGNRPRRHVDPTPRLRRDVDAKRNGAPELNRASRPRRARRWNSLT